MPTPVFKFADLIVAVTVDEAQSAVYDVLAQLGVSTSSWKTGSVVRTMIRALCIVYSGFSELQALGIQSGFLPLAIEEWLTAKAHYDYAVDRYAAAAATGLVTFTNSSAYEYSELAGDVIVASSSATGKNYRTTEDLVLPAGATVSVFVVAIEAGTGSNANAGEISVLVTTLLGVTCSNPNALVGSDEEPDQLLRTRCTAKMASLSPNGAPAAYEFVALSSVRADGTNVGITRVKTTNDTLGNVYVYLADADGEVAPDDVALIEENIESVYKVVPLAVFAHVSSATAVTVTIQADLWVHGSALSDDDIEKAASDALTAFFAVQPIGGNIIAPATSGAIYLDAIRAAIMEAVPTAFHCALTTPTGDIALAAYEVAVLSAVTIVPHHEL